MHAKLQLGPGVVMEVPGWRRDGAVDHALAEPERMGAAVSAVMVGTVVFGG